MRRGRASAAAVSHDEISHDPREEPKGKHPEAELPVAETAHAAPDLADDVEDRAAGNGVEGEFERFGADAVAEHRAEQGRGAGDHTDHRQPGPARPHLSERTGDAEPLGGVVKGEADDQDRRQRDSAAPRRRRRSPGPRQSCEGRSRSRSSARCEARASAPRPRPRISPLELLVGEGVNGGAPHRR